MYIVKLEQAQNLINVLQTKPYKDVYVLIDAITKSQKTASGEYLFTPQLIQGLGDYLGNLPFTDVFQVIPMLNNLPQYKEQSVEEPRDDYSESESVTQLNESK